MTNHNDYLLLIVITIRNYRNHTSKAFDFYWQNWC